MNYIFKNNNKISQFYYSDNNIVEKKSINNSWEKEKVLLENRKSNYTATSFKDKIYFFTQNTKGDVVLSILDNSNITERIILKNQSNTSKTFRIYFHPLISDNSITLIYTAFMDNANVLLMQKMTTNGKWEQPIKLDIIKPFKNCPIIFEQISETHALIFYQKKDRNNTKLGFREINLNNYGEFKSIHSTTYQITDLSTLSIPEGIFTAYIIKGMFSYQLIFRKKQKDFNNPIVLAENQIIDKPILFLYNNILYLLYTIGPSVYITYSEDYGSTFSSIEKLKKENGNNLIKSFYTDINRDKYISKEIYLSLDRELKIIPEFCNDFFTKETENETIYKPSDDEQINLLEERIHILQNKLIESQKSQNNKDKQIIALTKSIQDKSNEMNLLINDIQELKKFSSKPQQIDEENLLETEKTTDIPNID